MKRPVGTHTLLVVAAVLAVLAAHVGTQSAPAAARPRPAAAAVAAPAPAGAASYVMALTGDSLITRKLSVYKEPAFVKLIDLIRGADVAVTNLEMLFHDYESYAMNESGGTYTRADPALAGELKWAGFQMVSRANNHTGDYGVTGMRLTTKYVAQAGLVQAGVGESLAEAREAKFLETERARVALVSVSATFPDHARAGRTRGDVPPRPGLSPLRYSTTYTLTRERFDALRTTLTEAGAKLKIDGTRMTALGATFEVGGQAGMRTAANQQDLAEVAAVVKSASRLADYTIVAVHSHETEGPGSVPPDFLVTFARAMIDAGADVVAGHGPHVLQAVEIYKGKPILYSLGNFIFQNETLLRLPSENYEKYGLGPDAHVADFDDARSDFDRSGWPAERMYWEAVVAVPRWAGRTLVELKLQPITLGFGQPKTQRGRPMLAEGDTARKIVDDLARMSKPYGTQIVERDGVGVVVLNGAGTR